MKRRRLERAVPLGAILAAFCAGLIVDSLLREFGPPQPARQKNELTWEAPPDERPRIGPHRDERTVPAAGNGHTAGQGDPAVASDGSAGPTTAVGTTWLRPPIDDMKTDTLDGDFTERRGDHPHEAIDILAPRQTPIHAVQDGTIAKLFFSKQGGLTIYQFDLQARLCFYYAHLERYAEHLREGDRVSQGQVIGYVGTSGNAPPNTPHLHFAVFELGDDRKWWKGHAIDPYPLLVRKSE